MRDLVGVRSGLIVSTLLGTLWASSALGAEAVLSLSDRGVQATVVSLEGRGTRSAHAIGRVTRANALEYCRRDPGGETRANGGKLTVGQCVEEYLRPEQGRAYIASADCKARLLRSTFREGNPYRVVRVNREDGELIWRSEATREVLDNSTASGGAVLGAQFRLLCPE